MSATNEATARQIEAADPGSSTWLSANAGSGKTRVLTDRVARLLLDGASPQNILCLTYTRAAASEMQNRLFRRLGDWAMMPDDVLREKLGELGVEGSVGAERLRMARTLFARAIETPGGLKIQTIHSFCASLLRRFPLEAGVSPQFVEMDDRAAQLLIAEIVEEMAEDLAPDVIDGMARFHSGEDFAAVTRDVTAHRDRFFPPRDDAALRKLFGLDDTDTAHTLLAQVFLGGEAELLARVGMAMRGGGVTDARNADTLATARCDPPTLDDLEVLESLFLYGPKTKAPFGPKIGSFPGKAVQGVLVGDMPALDALMLRVEAARDKRLALLAVERSIALHRFAQVFLPLYESRKLARGWLDFEDLILKARGLMTDPSVAQWVLFRLDGGLDHILVDEAQDTSPNQWRVIELLAQEFAAGHGVRAPGERSLFVVGDRKQSIYSFQGADPKSFGLMFDKFRSQLAGHAPLQQLELQFSFRSSAAVLTCVDAVFGRNGDDPLALCATHRAFHETMPGRVDLWPLVEPDEAEPDSAWYDPVDRVAPGAAGVQLARAIAGEIRRMIDARETIPAQDGTRRPVSEGDFLILVQRRNVLFHEIIRACKQAGLAIAGADRLRLGGELAVRDLSALLAFLATPEDDLSLACALRSPLFGWSEAQLFDLAANRGERFLWAALRDKAGQYPDTLRVLRALRNDADFLRPYDLLDRILLRHSGRTNLLARLGPEAQDGLDELLNQALAYERSDVPSLTGFLAWLDADSAEVKRQADSAGNRIRVMSVHGAKGLESPIVILPDTLRPKRDVQDQTFPAPDGTPLWRTLSSDMPAVLARSKAGRVAADDAERARLLYVAMTRAESWLIVCGGGKPAKGSWYETVESAMTDLGAKRCAFPTGEGFRFAHGKWDSGAVRVAPEQIVGRPALPAWIRTVAPEAEAPAPLLNPSDLGGAKALPGEIGDWTLEDSLSRGTDLHLLLEHLPGFTQDTWADVATGLLGPERAADVLPEAIGVLTAPALASLFTPKSLAEVEIATPLPDCAGRRMIGAIDRLIIEDAHIVAVDFKSNRQVPETPDAVPEGILRQMGAYAAALAGLYPGRRIETAILWTRIAQLMLLPDPLVRAALVRAATLDAAPPRS